VFLLALGALAAVPARATILTPETGDPLADTFQFQPGIPAPDLSLLVPAPPSAATQALARAVERGLWSRACAIATDTLARRESDIEALTVFAICSAVTNDSEASGKALQRLQDAEGTSGDRVSLVQGIVRLRAGAAVEAVMLFDDILQKHPDDPLTLYFLGTALRAENRTADAIMAFRRLLQRWPDHSPALVAIAGLTAGPDAKAEDLQAAIALTEHATRIEPMNRAYWRLLAELYDRSGQHARASAVTLQWLSAPRAR
jgi:cytochrome c-type biogenesis protein CcmH/NrfG